MHLLITYKIINNLDIYSVNICKNDIISTLLYTIEGILREIHAWKIMFSRKVVPCSLQNIRDRYLANATCGNSFHTKAVQNVKVILVMSKSANVIQVWLVDFINEFFHFP